MSIDYIELARESAAMRGLIRQAADAGDTDEVTRLLQRVKELELRRFAVRYVAVRHSRATNPGAHRGYSPDLDAAEAELSALLAGLGQPHHTRGA